MVSVNPLKININERVIELQSELNEYKRTLEKEEVRLKKLKIYLIIFEMRNSTSRDRLSLL